MKPKTSLKKATQGVEKLKKKGHISYSQIQNGRCLFKYKMVNLLGNVKVVNDAMREGSFVHDVIYEYTRQCIEAGHESDAETMEKIFDAKFTSFKLDQKIYPYKK